MNGEVSIIFGAMKAFLGAMRVWGEMHLTGF